MAAFSFLNWLLRACFVFTSALFVSYLDPSVMVLNIFLLSLAIIQANRGNSGIWTSCVTDVDYSAPAAGTAGTTEPKVAYGSPTVSTPVTQYSQPISTPVQTYPPQQVYNPQQQPGFPMVGQV